MMTTSSTSSSVITQLQSSNAAVLAVVVCTIGLTFVEEYLNEEVYVLLGFVALSAYMIQSKKKANKTLKDEPTESQDDGTADGVHHPWSSNSHRVPLSRQHTFNIRITDAMKDKDPGQAERIIKEMRAAKVEPDVVTFNTLIQGYSQLGMLREAEACFKKIENSESMEADAYTYAPIVKGHAYKCMDKPENTIEYLRTAERWLTRMREAGICADASLYNIILDLLSKSEQGARVDAWLFEMMEDGPKPNTESYNAGIGVWGRVGSPERMESWFKRMKMANNVQMDYHTMDKLIMGYGKAGLVEKAEHVFYTVMSEQEVAPHANNYNSMLRVYGRSGLFDKMETFFDLMKGRGVRPGVQTYQAVVKAYSMAYLPEKVMRMIEHMRDDGLKPFEEANILTMTLQSFGQEPWRSNVRQNQMKHATAMLKEAHDTGAVIDKEVMSVFERLVGTVQATTVATQLKLTNTGWTPKKLKSSGAAQRMGHYDQK